MFEIEEPGKMPNRLAKEASPYLQQHASNPVDWYPWGEEALARAKKEDKPILLSIGYSACHWCHVMEHESFSDDATAKLMNELFVNIKVDREERPDLDQVYQLVVQLLGRSGGWPLTVFLTPDQKPFFGGTYFPNREKYGMPSFQRVLHAISDAYRTKKDEVSSQAGEIVQAIGSVLTAEPGEKTEIAPGIAVKASRKLVARFDEKHGGFGDRPKFPNPTSLEVLLLAGQTSRTKHALLAMRAGGIWDHLGGGFHRYSTDEKWLVPHFEKMLYDNALLLRLYADGFRALGEASFEATAKSIVSWLAREMTDASGAFYSTQDADSEGEEGKFFVWSPGEIRAAVGDEAAAKVAIEAFGVTDEGNFEETGKSVLFAARPPSDPALFEKARASMLAARDERIKPMRDDKILASWNALMIGALADASSAFGQPDWLDRAKRAYAYVREHLTHGDLRVRRLAKDGVVKGEGFLDDHAYLAAAALDLWEATGESHYLVDARALANAILAHFHDAKNGGFYFAPDDGESLIVRAKDTFDSAVPSGAAVACRALLRLGQIAGEPYLDVATRELERVLPASLDNPFGCAHFIGGLERLVMGSTDIVLVGARTDPRMQTMAKTALGKWVPYRNVVWVDPGDPETTKLAIAEGKAAQATPCAYVCRNRTCSPPADERALAEILRT